MKKLLQKAAQAVLRIGRRFMADAPANMYERIAFKALRDIAMNFGKAMA